VRWWMLKQIALMVINKAVEVVALVSMVTGGRSICFRYAFMAVVAKVWYRRQR